MNEFKREGISLEDRPDYLTRRVKSALSGNERNERVRAWCQERVFHERVPTRGVLLFLRMLELAENEDSNTPAIAYLVEDLHNSLITKKQTSGN